MRKFVAAISLLSLLAAPTAYAAGPAGLAKELKKAPNVRYIVEKRQVMGPFAFATFCARKPSECRPNSGTGVVALDSSRDRQLRDVNARVNREISPKDEPMNASFDVWDVNVAEGDCEDFALTKRNRLIAMGWPSRSLRIAVAKTAWGEGHAVLVVKTDRGDLVLDNRTNVIKDWRSAGLSWTMIQSANNPRNWHNL